MECGHSCTIGCCSQLCFFITRYTLGGIPLCNIRVKIFYRSTAYGIISLWDVFGAGNLIFPVQLGQMAGSHWVLATAGFLITGTVVPYLAMLAVSTTHSQSVYDLAKPVAPWFGMALLVLIHMTIGPFFGTPRTAATGFTMGIAPFLPEQWQTLGMVIFQPYSLDLLFSQYHRFACNSLDWSIFNTNLSCTFSLYSHCFSF
ncbi:LIV-II [Weissella viridescens]|uniref:Branched-chain amino acid transport system carrier protein n=1 Tax=Weissella viridescens TaxID=1629 RepID=A0A380NZB5_WEIVI|nr:LIV-II [Weissella viridescens]